MPKTGAAVNQSASFGKVFLIDQVSTKMRRLESRFPLKGKAIEKLEICLPCNVADLFTLLVSRFTNSGSKDHAANSSREGHSCSEGGSIDRWHRRRSN